MQTSKKVPSQPPMGHYRKSKTIKKRSQKAIEKRAAAQMQVLKRRWDISPPHLWVSGRLVLRWLGQRGWVRGGESVSQLSVEFFIERPFTFFFFFRNFVVIRHGRL